MRIKTSVNLYTTFIVSAAVVLIIVNVVGLDNIRVARQQQALSTDIGAAVLDLNVLAGELRRHQNDRVFRQFNNRIQSLLSLLNDLRDNEVEQGPVVVRMIRRTEGLAAAFEGLQKAHQQTDKIEVDTVRSEVALMNSLLSASHTLASLSNRLTKFQVARIDRIERNVLTATTGTAVFIILTVLVVYFASMKSVFRPLLRLTARIRKMAPDAALPFARAERPTNEIQELSFEFDRRYEALQSAEAKLAVNAANLKRSNTDLEEFAYAASHDLRSPLRGIMTVADWIAEDMAEKMDDETKENLALIQSRAERMDNLLNALLRYSRATTKDHIMDDVDVVELIEDIELLIDRPKGIVVQVEGPMPTLKTIGVHLHQVLHNLIDNAAKHHDQDVGRILVTAEDRGDFVRFQITDDGPGIAPEFHEKVMQIFQTLHSRDEREASGMGLALVKRLVERHGGTIDLQSPITGNRGTSFRFTWHKN